MSYTNDMNQLDPKSTWLFFVTALGRGLPLILVLFFVWTSLYSNDELPSAFTDVISWLLPLGILVVLAVALVWARLTWRFYKYEMREDGFRKESGIIWKKYTTIPYGRVQNVEIYRGLIARILGLSDLHIQTAGGVAQSRYGAFSEGRLPGLSRADAEKIRDDLIKRVQQNSPSQGL